MCIIADNVKDVSETKIASFHVAYSLDNAITILPGQLVVYAAKVDSMTNTNALILPIYNPGNDYRKIIPLDFSDESSFFWDLNLIYDRWFPSGKWKIQSLSANSYSNNSESILAVHKVGDYKFSIMPSKIDFHRINRAELNINPSAKTSIDAHSDDYSFIIYQFYQKGRLDVSPFGYICPSYNEYSMIVPTIHGHPHDEIMASASFGNYYGRNVAGFTGSDFEQSAEFDHVIYTLVKNPSKLDVPKKDLRDINDLLKKINIDYMKRKIIIYPPKSFIPNKIIIKGHKTNRNIIVDPKKYTFIHDLLLDNNSVMSRYGG